MPKARIGKIEIPDQPDTRESVDAVWGDYKRTGSIELRDLLIVHYTPLVKYVASRVAVGLPANIERADLVSYGVFGLIDAISRFEPDREVKFETYALTRIRGAIIDELRQIDWIPRSLRTKAKEMDRASAALETALRRSPTEAELAAELGIDVGELRQLLGQLSYANVIALDELLSGASREETERVSLVETLHDQRVEAPGFAIEAEETRRILARAINRLPQREKVVVTLYYYEGLTLAEIGQVLGVTESRICQMHSKAVVALKSKLAEEAS